MRSRHPSLTDAKSIRFPFVGSDGRLNLLELEFGESESVANEDGSALIVKCAHVMEQLRCVECAGKVIGPPDELLMLLVGAHAPDCPFTTTTEAVQ